MKTKKITRKLLVWALTLAMVMSMCSIFVSAADPAIDFTVTPSTAKAGDAVEFAVKFDNALAFSNIRFEVNFDTDVFEIDESKLVENEGMLSSEDIKFLESPIGILNIDVDGGKFVYANMTPMGTISNAGTILSGKLYVKDGAKAGNTDLNFKMYEIQNTSKDVAYSINSTKQTVKIEAKPVAVTGVSLDKTTLTLTEGDSATLAATVAPSDATNKAVTWSTSDDKIATVADGKVTAVKAGKATITVKTADGNKTATCEVTVEAKPEIKPESISIPETAELTIGGKQTLKATVLPENAAGTITWTSSDEKIAKVSASGEVSAIGIGTAEITASVGEVVSNKCVVTVNGIDLEGIAIDPAEAQINIGSTKKLNVVYDPANTTDDKTVTWSSSDEAIATVANDGTVTAVAEGEATITATCGAFTATSKITVTNVKVTGIKLDKTTVSVAEGKTVTLKATITPDDAANKAVNWSSSDESIATVDENGVVTAVKKGTATITAVSVDGEFKAECTVSVLTQEEYDEYVKTADPAVYAIAFIIALMSVAFMGALIVLKRKQSAR